MVTTRALRNLNKGREYLMTKPEDNLDSESDHEYSGDPSEQSSEVSSNDWSAGTSENSCERYNIDEDERSKELSSGEESETESMGEAAPSKVYEVSANQTVVVGETNSQNSERSYQTAVVSTSPVEPNDVAITVEDYDNIEDDKQE